MSSFNWNVPAVTKTKNNAKVKVILKANGTTVANAVSAKFTVQQ
jgi:DNA-binding protein